MTATPLEKPVEHLIRSWSCDQKDETPLCGADRQSPDVWGHRTMFRDAATCADCLRVADALRAAFFSDPHEPDEADERPTFDKLVEVVRELNAEILKLQNELADLKRLVDQLRTVFG